MSKPDTNQPDHTEGVLEMVTDINQASEDKLIEYPPEKYFDTSTYPDNRVNRYCIYYLSWADKNKYNLSFSCGRYIKNLSRYTNKFKRLDTGTDMCACGRQASQGELG